LAVTKNAFSNIPKCDSGMTPRKRVLFTGISGFLGWHFAKISLHEWEIHGIANSHPADINNAVVYQVDITDYEDIKSAMEKIRPDAVIHAAALADPNECELNPDRSYIINVEAVQNIAGLCANRAIPFLFTSTDLVFGGEHPPYSEDDVPNPVNVYGEHKARAEELVLENYPNTLIVRLPLMFGDPGPVASNFYQYMLGHLTEGTKLELFKDEYRSMLSGTEAVRGLLAFLGRHSGIVHLGGPDSISRYEFGLKLADVFGGRRDKFIPVSSHSVPAPPARPRDVSLTNFLAREWGFTPTSLEHQLKECYTEFSRNE